MSSESGSAWTMRGLKRWLSATPETRDDLVQLLEDSRRFLEPDTVDMLTGVLGLPKTPVREIMTPRPSVVGLFEDDELMEILPVLIESAHSRFPVFSRDGRDSVVGVLLAKDLLRFIQTPTTPFNLHHMLRQPVFVPETARSDQLLGMLKHTQTHMAVVVDEYGATAGLITLEDLLEEIVGEIEDEHDNADPLADCIIPDPEFKGSWLVQALTPIEHFNDELGADLEGEGVDTIGGLLLERTGLVSELAGQTVDIENWQFTVLAADLRSLTLLRARRAIPVAMS
ncbi:MAG: CBS domain-containing protein [Gammaproteobacteria bacterium]|nr:CBS domain-containing protein [Gammaproteobacteria bacterium]